jgi:hypothetical protein
LQDHSIPQPTRFAMDYKSATATVSDGRHRPLHTRIGPHACKITTSDDARRKVIAEESTELDASP